MSAVYTSCARQSSVFLQKSISALKKSENQLGTRERNFVSVSIFFLRAARAPLKFPLRARGRDIKNPPSRGWEGFEG